MKRFQGKKGFIILIVSALLIVGYYFYLSHISDLKKEEKTEPISIVQNILLRDLATNYPPSPKEVVKYYAEMTKCFYDGDYTEEEFLQLADKAKEMYDEELIANKTNEEYLADLRADIEVFKQKECKISSYSTSSSIDVEYFTEDGSEFARLYCMYTLRQKTEIIPSNYVYLLRKDESGHYKIYGWDLEENVKKDEQE